MAPALPAPEISFGRAALCAGISEKALRGWLDRKLVTLSAESQRAGRGWRRFTVTDVVRIAVMKRIVDFGFGIEVADEMLRRHFDGVAFTARYLADQLPEARTLENQLLLEMLIILRDGRSASVRGALPHEAVYRLRSGKDPELVSAPWEARPGSEWFLSESASLTDFIVIRMGRIAIEVIKRLEDGAI